MEHWSKLIKSSQSPGYYLAKLYREAEADLKFLEGCNEAWLKDEIITVKKKLIDLENQYKQILSTKCDEIQELIIEIRAGVGGCEASLFVGNLYNMYIKYIEYKQWSYKVLNISMSDVKGFKEIILKLRGLNAYRVMTLESGIHRVQRIPTTETKGRIHTSTASVTVLEVPKETTVHINSSLLRVDVYRSSGAGGQSVNTTESAVRLTYNDPLAGIIVVTIQNERSQHSNKAKAMEILRTKLHNIYNSSENSSENKARKEQTGNVSRSEKIRTYNMHANRITDHRSKNTIAHVKVDRLMDPEHLDHINKQ